MIEGGLGVILILTMLTRPNQGDAAVSHRIGDLKLVAVAALGRKPA